MVGFSGDDAACIEVDDVAHALGELRVGGDLDDRSDWIACWRAKAGGEEDEVRSGTGLSRHALDIVAWSTEQGEAGRGGVLREVEHVAYGSDSTLARGAC